MAHKKITLKDIQRLVKNGFIRGYKDVSPKKQPGKRQRVPRPVAPQVVELSWALHGWCQMKNEIYIKEYQFAKDESRNYRFDFAIPRLLIAIEYEGIYSEQSGHTTLEGYNKDVEKYNLAAKKGWKVYRVTAKNYKQLIRVLDEHISYSDLPGQRAPAQI